MQTMRLSDTGPMSAEEVGRVVLSVAHEVAELHRNDVVHGYIRPSRISLTGDLVELDPPDGAGFSKPHDVRSIGELSLHLLSRWGLPCTGPLADVARQAAAIDPSARPTVEQLVEHLELALSTPDAPPDRPEKRTGTRRRVTIGLGAALILACIAIAIARWALLEPPPPSTTRAEVAPGDPVPATTTPLPARVWPQEIRACSQHAGALMADLDGDGCEEPLELRDGRLVSDAGGVAITGAKVDDYVTGDWNCSQRSTLAVLDTDTGAIYLFPGWSRPGNDVTAISIGRVRDATALVASDEDGDGCDELRAFTANGDRVRIEVPFGARP